MMTSAADHGLTLAPIEARLNLNDPDELFDHLIRNYMDARWLSYSDLKRARRLARIVGRHWDLSEADVLEAAAEMFREWEYDCAVASSAEVTA
jgi:hypothetical protein